MTRTGESVRASLVTVPGILSLAVLFLTVTATTPIAAQRSPSFDIVEASIGDMQRALQDKRVTSRELVISYLAVSPAGLTDA
jgi:hypothetical protein